MYGAVYGQGHCRDRSREKSQADRTPQRKRDRRIGMTRMGLGTILGRDCTCVTREVN